MGMGDSLPQPNRVAPVSVRCLLRVGPSCAATRFRRSRSRACGRMHPAVSAVPWQGGGGRRAATFRALAGFPDMNTFLKVLLAIVLVLVAIKILPLALVLGGGLLGIAAAVAAVSLTAAVAIVCITLALAALLSPIWLAVIVVDPPSTMCTLFPSIVATAVFELS